MDIPVPDWAGIVVIGGGVTGASAAVQRVRLSHRPLAITRLDPADQPGRSLAALGAGLAALPALIAHPLGQPQRLQAVPADARVLCKAAA